MADQDDLPFFAESAGDQVEKLDIKTIDPHSAGEGYCYLQTRKDGREFLLVPYDSDACCVSLNMTDLRILTGATVMLDLLKICMHENDTNPDGPFLPVNVQDLIYKLLEDPRCKQ